MKTIYVLLFSLFICLSSYSQVNTDFLLTLKPEKVKPFNPKTTDNTITLPMEFGTSTFTKKCGFLSKLDVVQVDMYYSDYQQSTNFDQPKLNRNRFNALLSSYPFLKDKILVWTVKSQTAKSEDEAKKMFHGFLVHFRPTLSKTERKKEMDSLLALASGVVLDSCIEDTITKTKYKTRYKKTAYYRPLIKKRYKKGILCENEKALGLFKRRVHRERYIDTITTTQTKTQCYASDSSKKAWEAYSTTLDSLMPAVFPGYSTNFGSDTKVIEEVFKRNHWDNMVITTDVTGSMGAYIFELLAWHKLNFDKRNIKAHYFFNDGDFKRYKPIGKTGGIYKESTDEYSRVEKQLQKAMRAGGGGDAPENDVEALLQAMSDYKDSTVEYILVADNYSPMRDVSLIKKLNQPVHVLVCGGAGMVHPEYLELAKATGGSVHTIYEDLTDLADISEGSRIKIGDYNYIVKGGKFELDTSTYL